MRGEGCIRLRSNCDRLSTYDTVTVDLIEPFRLSWQKLPQNAAVRFHVSLIVAGLQTPVHAGVRPDAASAISTGDHRPYASGPRPIRNNPVVRLVQHRSNASAT